MSRPKKTDISSFPKHFTFIFSDRPISEAFHVDVPDERLIDGIIYALDILHSNYPGASNFYVIPFDVDRCFYSGGDSDER